MQHEFAASLTLSHKQADAEWWPRVYRSAFPDLASMTCVRQDGWAQRGGIASHDVPAIQPEAA